MKLVRNVSGSLSLVLCTALAGAQGTLDDRYLMQVDSANSQVQYEIDSNLGLCTLSPSANGSLGGNLWLRLQPGAFPISSGQYDGGDCSCQPDLVGTIPNTLPGLPPILEVELSSLVIAPRSHPFTLDGSGAFLADSSFDVDSGRLVCRVLGGPSVPVSLVGMSSDGARSHGTVWIDGTGVHAVREVANALTVDVPQLGLSLRIAIRGQVRSDMGFPVPTRFCPATANSTGLPARLDFAGTSSVSRNDGRLLVSQCPPGRTGLFLAGDQQGQVVFGNGTRCATGTVLRLAAAQVDATGAAAQRLDLQAPPAARNVVAGSHWSFQFAYRDPAAGGASVNISGALAIAFVP